MKPAGSHKKKSSIRKTKKSTTTLKEKLLRSTSAAGGGQSQSSVDLPASPSLPPSALATTLASVSSPAATVENPSETLVNLVTSTASQNSVRPSPSSLQIPGSWDRSVEEKRLLIRKQLVVLLHAIVCRRRDLTRGTTSTEPCIVPFCGLMKNVLTHLNGCRSGRTCATTHCASSRQILIHWKYCVKTECPVCVSLRLVVPSSLLQIFPNPLCRAEILNRVARTQRINGQQSEQSVPELMESEE